MADIITRSQHASILKVWSEHVNVVSEWFCLGLLRFSPLADPDRLLGYVVRNFREKLTEVP